LLGLLGLVAIEYALYFALVPSRPSADDRFEHALPGGPFANALGQGGAWQIAYGVILICSLYAAKTGLVYRCTSDAKAWILYILCILLCLPVLWVCVTTDWNNPHAALAYWFTLPIGLLLVPTVGMAAALARRPYRRVSAYVVKTGVECLLIPVWLYLWTGAEFALGFYWI
jgi:hypothetical protein